jgi:hypothetical protein
MASHKPGSSVSERSLFILILSLGLGVVFNWLLVGMQPGVSFPLFIGLGLLGMGVVFHKFQPKLKVSNATAMLTAACMFFAGMVFVRGGGLITFMNICMTGGLGLLLLYTVFRPRLRSYRLGEYVRAVAFMPPILIQKSVQAVGELTAVQKVLRKHQSTSQVLRGVLITLPVLLLFGVLFSSADLVFRHYAASLFGFHINGELVFRTILVLLVACAAAGVFQYITQKPEAALAQLPASPEEKAVESGKSRGQTEATILFGSVNVLFLSFIAIQLAYLFGGERNVVGQGFTYADYARKGFFELIAVAVLSLVVVLVAEKVLAPQGEKHTTRFKVLRGALVAQVLVIMASAFNRLSLYESTYGFTSLRLYSHIFIVWLAVIFGVLLYKIFVDRRASTFAYLSFCSLLILVATFNVVNIDAVVARKNIRRYHATGKVDAKYLAHVSDDGIAEAAKLLDTQDAKLRNDFAGQLFYRYQNLQTKNEHWQSANLSRQSALQALGNKQTLLEQANRDRPQLDLTK